MRIDEIRTGGSALGRMGVGAIRTRMEDEMRAAIEGYDDKLMPISFEESTTRWGLQLMVKCSYDEVAEDMYDPWIRFWPETGEVVMSVGGCVDSNPRDRFDELEFDDEDYVRYNMLRNNRFFDEWGSVMGFVSSMRIQMEELMEEHGRMSSDSEDGYNE